MIVHLLWSLVAALFIVILKKNHNLDIINSTTAELKWPEPGRSRQNFDPEPEPPKSRAAPQPWKKGIGPIIPYL